MTATETDGMRIRKIRIAIPNLPAGLEGYRILHLSDLHFNNTTAKDSKLWSILHDKEPADIVLITGDFITYDKYIDSVVEWLSGVRAKDGAYGILGNHDYAHLTIAAHARHFITRRPYASNDWQRLRSLLESGGIRILVNERYLVRTRSNSVLFLEGTDDPVSGRPAIAEPDSDFHTSDFKILLSHSPDILYSPEIRKKKFDLLLSGHTHGGQIRLPIVGPLWTATRFANRKESSGAYCTAAGTHVNISNGIGYSMFPIRINCPAEICVIELVKAAAPSGGEL